MKKYDLGSVKEICEYSGYTLIDNNYKDSNTPISVIKNDCGHTTEVKVSELIKGRKPCKVCNKRNTAEDFYNKLAGSGIKAIGKYKNMRTNVLVEYACGHTHNMNPGHLMYNNIGIKCTQCNTNTVKNRLYKLLDEYAIIPVDTYITTQMPMQVKYACGHIGAVIPNNMTSSGSGIDCPICNAGSTVSRQEKEIVEYIKSIYSGWVIENDRTILEGKELDIVIPDLGIAIEFNGSRWHSEEAVGKDYHLNKLNKVNEFGYSLLSITDTEWTKDKDIVLSRISNRIGSSKKIYARKCSITKLNTTPVDFLENNHSQGAGTRAAASYGLVYNDELVAVMTFGKPRFNKNYEYELLRYCTKKFTNVIGGASKLLKAFEKEYAPKSIISYADRRWSDGTLYSSLGFSLSHVSAPNYCYHKYKTVLTRYACQKHLLKAKFPDTYSDDLSESEIMKLNGFNKVFDCGNLVFYKVYE